MEKSAVKTVDHVECLPRCRWLSVNKCSEMADGWPAIAPTCAVLVSYDRMLPPISRSHGYSPLSAPNNAVILG